MIDIDEIKARCEAATPGPWHTTVDGSECYIDINEDESVGSVFYESDAAFIAHSREDIPYLLSELERTQAELAAEREAKSSLLSYLEGVANSNRLTDRKIALQAIRIIWPNWPQPERESERDGN